MGCWGFSTAACASPFVGSTGCAGRPAPMPAAAAGKTAPAKQS